MPEAGGSALYANPGQPLVLAAAGTRQQLPSLGTAGGGKTVTIQALGTNEGKIVVGDKTVVAASGTHAAPKQVGIALNAGATISIEIVDTADIWFDGTVTGDAISYITLLA